MHALAVVFTCPYVAKPSFANRSIDADECPTLAAAATALQRDSAWKAAAQELKRSFLGKAEALIHGDLHTGSVMVTPTVGVVVWLRGCVRLYVRACGCVSLRVL